MQPPQLSASSPGAQREEVYRCSCGISSPVLRTLEGVLAESCRAGSPWSLSGLLASLECVHVYMWQGPAGFGCIGPRYTCLTQDVLRRAALPCGHKQVHQVAKISQGCPCIWDSKVATARIVRRSVLVSGPLGTLVLHVQHARTQQPSLPLQTHVYLSGLRQEADVV